MPGNDALNARSNSPGLQSRRLTCLWLTDGNHTDSDPANRGSTDRTTTYKPAPSTGSKVLVIQDGEFCLHRARHPRQDTHIGDDHHSWVTTSRDRHNLAQADFVNLYPNWITSLIKTILDLTTPFASPCARHFNISNSRRPRIRAGVAGPGQNQQLAGKQRRFRN